MCGLKYREYALTAAIRHAEAPTPIKARASHKLRKECDMENISAPAAANTISADSTRRGPYRSSMTPNGNCMTAKAKK